MTGPCEPIQEEMLFFVEGELDPRTASLVEAHLETCTQCRERADRMRSLNRVLFGLTRLPFEGREPGRGSRNR